MITNIELGVIITLLIPWKRLKQEWLNWKHRQEMHQLWLVQEAAREAVKHE